MPDLTRIPGVELIRTGRWPVSSGSWTASAEDLVSAVAALGCPSIRRPVLKLGHIDPRFDGEPAIGYVDNLRVTDGGHTLVGDYAGVPSWLGSIAASAYPDRSVEGTYSFRCQQGHTHPFVLTAVALLGVTPPGVGSLKSLQDVAALYGVAAAGSDLGGGVRVTATIGGQDGGEVAAADSPKPGSDKQLRLYWTKGKGAIKIRWGDGGDFKRCVRHLGKFVKDPEGLCAEYHHEALGYWPATHARMDRDKKVHASPEEEGAVPSPEPTIADRIRSAFNATQPENRWIVEIDDSDIVVIDDSDRTLHRIPVEVGDEVTFGPAVPVRMAYVPADSDLVAASRTVFASRAESRPEVAATVLDTPPPDPRPVAEPQPPSGPPPTEEEPATPPDEGGVSGPPQTPGAEPGEPNTDPEKGVGLVSTLSTDVRSRLGLPDDADDAAILAALDGLKTQAEKPAEPSPELVAASAAKDEENAELRKEVSVLASQMQQVTTELAASKAEKAATVKASVIQAALDEGRIAPADRAQWETDYDEAPNAVTRILASIAPGTKVPTSPAGYTGTGDEASADAIDSEYERLFNVPQKAGA